MDRIRRIVEHDPYEALFGYSNRLLKGTRGDFPAWWQREMSFTVRNPFVVQKSASVSEAVQKTEPVAPAETEMEYDPISGRMVTKAASSSPQMATPGEPAASNITEATEYIKPRDDEAVDIPVKPYRPKVEASDVPTRAAPSFTMLKEDLPEISSTGPDAVPVSPTRAEYERYKARRLEQAEKTSQWLESEGFRESKTHSTTAGLRGDLETRFDDLHSRDHDLVDQKIVEKKPWEAQRSKGSTITAGATFAAWREKVKIPAYDAAKADREIHEYIMQVAGDNLKNKQAVEEAELVNPEPTKPRSPLVHPSADAQADKDIRDYSTRVASDNLKTRRLAEQQRARQETDERLAELRRKQFEEFNKATRRLAEERASTEDARKELRTVKATLLDAKARLAKREKQIMQAQSGVLQTSLERHVEKSAVTPSRPLKTSLQRLNGSSPEVVSRTEQSPLADTKQGRTHDPVGYNHERESSRLQHLNSTRTPFKVPSLADVFGYRKNTTETSKSTGKHEIDPSAGWLLGEIESQKAAFSKFESSRKDIGSTAAAAKGGDVSAAESKIPQATRAEEQFEQKKQDAALVREIRQIYEDKYGAITTSHTQPIDAPVKGDDAIPASSISSTLATATPIVDAASLQSSSTSKTKPRNESPPVSSLSTPTPSKLAKYTILAYDSKSKNMTTATFESIPSATENAFPTTVALRHLAYANRFLPKLIELQHRGFVPVHAERNLLILRQDSTKSAAAAPISEQETSDEDHIQAERFIDLHNNSASSSSSAAPAEGLNEPRRLEQVYSGSERHRERAWQKWKEAQRAERQRKRRRFGRAVKWTGGGVVLSAGVVYLAGVGAEVRQNRGRGKVVVTGEEGRQ